MSLHGSVVANLSPILFKGNNRIPGLNVIIHQDETESMFSPSTKVVYIAVQDEASPDENTIRSAWLNFRLNNDTTDRPFWLLQPGGGGSGSLNVPSEFSTDPFSYGPITVNRDEGNAGSRSDWFVICNLGSLPAGSRVYVAIDNSGSMTTSTVSASTSLLQSKCTSAGLQLTITTINDEVWSGAHSNNIPARVTPSSGFYSDGTFIQNLQDELLLKKIGDSIVGSPNLYAYFGYNGRNPSTAFTVTNSSGSLQINQSFIRGESSGAATSAKWTGVNYFSNISSHIVNVCDDGVNRLSGFAPRSLSEDVHGNIWSIFTTPNTISSGTVGRFGSVIDSNVRDGSTTVIITNSNEQNRAPGDMINNPVTAANGASRTINGQNGEVAFRKYKVIALSSYTSTDGFDGVLFYGSASTQPFGYVTFTSSTTYTITRSITAPNWTKSSLQLHDTLTLARESIGALFKTENVYDSGIDRRVAFSKCLAEFIVDTV